MKRLFLSVVALMCLSMVCFAKGSVKLCEFDYQVDTLFHAMVGPGTTQTSLLLTREADPTFHLRVFYTVTDLKHPGVSVRAVVAHDKLPGGQTVSDMAESHSTKDLSYFGGINTNFFYTRGNASSGESRVGEPTGSAAVDGEIYRTVIGTKGSPQFAIDAEGLPHIGRVSFFGTASCNGETVEFSVVNKEANDNTLSIYTPRHYRKMNNPDKAGKIAEVNAKLVSGESMQVGKPMVLEVVTAPTTTGDIERPADQYTIAGRGKVMAFVQNLKIGDKVTVNPMTQLDDKDLVLKQVCSGNPNILADGVTLDTEKDRGDAVARHPRSSIGYSADQTKVVMMVIDGRTALSAGVHTMELADMMRYAGAAYAINVDGGGSATLYTESLGVRNNPSDGRERADAAGMFTVLSAPEDLEIASIRFVDWAMELPQYGIYTPKFFGYNKYGVLIDKDVQGVKLSIDSKLGEIINNGTTLYASGTGAAAFNAEYKGCKTSIPVTIAFSDKVHLRLTDVLLDNFREYPVDVLATVVESEMPLNPQALTWSCDNEAVATINANTGVLKGVKDGTAVVTGKVGDYTGKLNVKVEIPTAAYMPVNYPEFPTNWTVKQVGGKDMKVSQFENGMKLDYVGNGAARGAYITLEHPMVIWSLPEVVRIRVNPGNATIKKISMNAENALGERMTSWVFTTTELAKNTESSFEVNLNEWCDPKDTGIYPIQINSLRFDMGVSAKDTPFTISVHGFEAGYPQLGGIENNFVAAENINVYPNPVKAGEAFNVAVEEQATVEVFALNGAKVLSTTVEGTSAVSTQGLTAGVYFVKVADNDSAKTAKLIVE